MHPKGWTFSLKNVQNKPRRACAISGLEELETHLASCGCSSPSCLCWSWDTCQRAHMMNKLHVASETCLHCVWEEGNMSVQCCLLEAVNAATGPAAGDVTSHRHCHYRCYYHCHTALHTKMTILALWEYFRFLEGVVYLYRETG